MTTYTYALSRTERVCRLFSVTLLASVLFYVMLAHWVVSDMNHPELTTCQQGFPLHLMIIGLFFTVTQGCTSAVRPGQEIAGGKLHETHEAEDVYPRPVY